jgi:hypothetical protein
MPADRCPLCGHDFAAGDVVAADSSPYSAAQRSYSKMVAWILLAGSQRLGYLARMRASRASAWFMAQNLLLLGVAGALVAAPRHGWVMGWDHGAGLRPDDTPSGQGWKPVNDQAPPAAPAAGPVLARLWWNPGLWVLAMGLAFVGVVLCAWLAVVLVRAGAELHLRSRYRGEGRFGAAFHYHTAHVHLQLLAAALYGASAVVPVAEIRSWPLRWPVEVHTAGALLIGAAALFMLWFWWLRLAHTSPGDTRSRLTWYFAVWAPLPPVILVGGWLWALDWLMPLVAKEAGFGQ